MVAKSELAKRRGLKAGKFLRKRAPMSPTEIAVMLLVQASMREGSSLSAAIAAKAARELKGKQSSLWRVYYLLKLERLDAQSKLYSLIGVPHGNVDQEAHAIRRRIGSAEMAGGSHGVQEGRRQDEGVQLDARGKRGA